MDDNKNKDVDDTLDNPHTQNAGDQDPPKPASNELTSAQFPDLREAVQVLYIRGNQSGRIYFTKEWPDVADYIFGHELIEIDTHGSDDRELRKELEEEAEERQYGLLKTFENLEENSAQSGVLQTDYVQGIVESLGRSLALLVYTDKIVDRFAPASAAPNPEPEPAPEPASQTPIEQPPIEEAPVSVKDAAQDIAPEIAPATETGENAQAQVKPASVEDAAQIAAEQINTDNDDKVKPREPRSVSGVVQVEKPE